MLKRPVYLGLAIGATPVIDVPANMSWLECLASKVPYGILAITRHSDEVDDSDLYKQAIHVTIHNIDIGLNGLLITFATRGDLPPGLRHGTYTILFHDGHISQDQHLPEEMYDPDWKPEERLLPENGEA